MTERTTLALTAGPIVLASLLASGYALAEWAGLPLLTDRPMNLAETVIEDDPPTLMRQLYAGENPLADYGVGADILVPPARRMTPMEAAALRDRASMLGLLLRHGVPVDDATRTHLLCIAERMGSKDVLAMLSRPGVTAACGLRADAVAPVPAPVSAPVSAPAPAGTGR